MATEALTQVTTALTVWLVDGVDWKAESVRVVDALSSLCRERGVRRAHVAFGGYTISVEMGDPLLVVAPPVVLTPTEKAVAEEAAAFEAERTRLAKSLGRRPSDEEVESYSGVRRTT